MCAARVASCLLALTLVGCGSDVPTDTRATLVPPAVGALDRQASDAVPITGTCDLTVDATIPFPAPPTFEQIASGTCDLSHVGLAHVYFVQVVNFATGTQHSLELTYTAPNGDVLGAQSAGTSVVNGGTAHFDATIEFLGGTGRFADASGQAHAAGVADLAAGRSHYALEGSIRYDASDRHP